jgi:hypothetical protein
MDGRHFRGGFGRAIFLELLETLDEEMNRRAFPNRSVVETIGKDVEV